MELIDPSIKRAEATFKEHPGPEHVVMSHSVRVPAANNAKMGWLTCETCNIIVGLPWWVFVNGEPYQD